jgi:hypothetical protein
MDWFQLDAATGTIGGILVILSGLIRLMRANTRQHSRNLEATIKTQSLLETIDDRTQKIDSEVDGLSEWTTRHDQHHRSTDSGYAEKFPYA